MQFRLYRYQTSPPTIRGYISYFLDREFYHAPESYSFAIVTLSLPLSVLWNMSRIHIGIDSHRNIYTVLHIPFKRRFGKHFHKTLSACFSHQNAKFWISEESFHGIGRRAWAFFCLFASANALSLISACVNYRLHFIFHITIHRPSQCFQFFC